MGEKGSKATATGAAVAEELYNKLASLGGITYKKMFGGYGIFHNSTMFGMVDPKGTISLKADDDLRQVFEKAGAKKHGKMPYYSVPEKVLASDKELVTWAKRSIALI